MFCDCVYATSCSGPYNLLLEMFFDCEYAASCVSI